jgi:hypothetical protein
MELQLLERGALADALLASCYLAVPGAGGGPHADAQPRPYSWSCTSPVQVPPPAGAAPADSGAAVYPVGAVFVRCGWVGGAAP